MQDASLAAWPEGRLGVAGRGNILHILLRAGEHVLLVLLVEHGHPRLPVLGLLGLLIARIIKYFLWEVYLMDNKDKFEFENVESKTGMKKSDSDQKDC